MWVRILAAAAARRKGIKAVAMRKRKHGQAPGHRFGSVTLDLVAEPNCWQHFLVYRPRFLLILYG